MTALATDGQMVGIVLLLAMAAAVACAHAWSYLIDDEPDPPTRPRIDPAVIRAAAKLPCEEAAVVIGAAMLELEIAEYLGSVR